MRCLLSKRLSSALRLPTRTTHCRKSCDCCEEDFFSTLCAHKSPLRMRIPSSLSILTNLLHTQVSYINYNK